MGFSFRRHRQKTYGDMRGEHEAVTAEKVTF
jgi:hypothetical protein